MVKFVSQWIQTSLIREDNVLPIESDPGSHRPHQFRWGKNRFLISVHNRLSINTAPRWLPTAEPRVVRCEYPQGSSDLFFQQPRNRGRAGAAGCVEAAIPSPASPALIMDCRYGINAHRGATRIIIPVPLP